MSSASGSFEDFMAGFMERHPNWFGSDSRPVQVVKAPMVKEAVKAPEIKPQVAKESVVEEAWDAAEVVEVEEETEWWNK